MACIMITLAPFFLLFSCVFTFPYAAITALTPPYADKASCLKPDIESLEACLEEFKQFRFERNKSGLSCSVKSTWEVKDGTHVDTLKNLCPNFSQSRLLIYGQGISLVEVGGARDCGCQEVLGLAKRLVEREAANKFTSQGCRASCESLAIHPIRNLADVCSAVKLLLHAKTDSSSTSATNDIACSLVPYYETSLVNNAVEPIQRI
jgi:hypothetical protein